MTLQRCIVATILALCVSLPAVPSRATDIYAVDPIAAKYTRTAATSLSSGGGRIDIPDSDGVSAEFRYPANDACSRSRVEITGLGPTGVDHANVDSIYQQHDGGWRPFYVLTIVINSACGSPWLSFRGFPRLSLSIPKARNGTIYYVDLVLQSGNDTHIPLGPPDEEDTKHVTFDFSELPGWAKENSLLRVPVGVTYRIVVARQ